MYTHICIYVYINTVRLKTQKTLNFLFVVHTVFAPQPKSPIWPQKSHIFLQNGPIQNSPIYRQESPTYPPKEPSSSAKDSLSLQKSPANLQMSPKLLQKSLLHPQTDEKFLTRGKYRPLVQNISSAKHVHTPSYLCSPQSSSAFYSSPSSCNGRSFRRAARALASVMRKSA